MAATRTSDLDCTGHLILNVADPTTDQGAATKKYVDDNAGAGGGTTIEGANGGFVMYDATAGKFINGKTITPTISADQNDWNPTGLNYVDATDPGAVRIEVSCSGLPLNITGLVGGYANRIIIITNASVTDAERITLVNQSASSTAANRFSLSLTTNNLLLKRGETTTLIYRATNSRWTPIYRAWINSGVTAGNYTNASLTVDESGRITAASSGAGLADGDKGDITVSASGATWLIDNGAVTYAKMQNVSAASRLLGRGLGAGAGSPEEISLSGGLSMTGTTLSGITDGDKGDITVSSTGAVWLIDNAAVTFAKIQNLATDKLLGRGVGAGAGPPQEISLGTNLSISGTSGAWVLNAASTATAAGSDKWVQFNDGGTALGAETAFSYDKTTDVLTLGGASGGFKTTTSIQILQSSNTINLWNLGVIGWSPSGNSNGGTDFAIKRNAAGVGEVNGGTAGPPYGDMIFRTARTHPVVYASRVTPGIEGMRMSFTDSTTNTTGAIIAGGGSFHVSAYYNGTDWVVESGTGGAGGGGKHTINFTWDGAGSVLTNGAARAYPTANFAGTITGYSISADAGTPTLKTWKVAHGTAVPTSANLISTSGLQLTTGTHVRSTTVTDFGANTAVALGDVFGAELTVTGSPTLVTFQIEITE